MANDIAIVKVGHEGELMKEFGVREPFKNVLADFVR